MGNSVYQFILYLVHAIIYVYSTSVRCFINIRIYLVDFWRNDTSHDFNTDLKYLLKRPNHLGVILTEEDFSMTDVSSIIVWSLAFGIHFISVYDTKGKTNVKRLGSG